MEIGAALDLQEIMFRAFQRLKDSVFSGGDAAFENLELRAYGKLPIYKDYILLGCEPEPATEFKRWLDVAFGLRIASLGDKNIRPESPKRLLWMLPETGQAAVASLWPSSDEGGLRKFPFSFFATVPKSALGAASIAERLPHLLGVWQALEAQYGQSNSASDIGEFYEQFSERSMQSIAIDTTGDSSTSLEQWFQAFGASDSGEFAGQLTENVSELIASGREYGSGGASLAVRLPLAPGIAQSFQVEMWMAVFQKHLKKCSRWPSMLLPGSETEDARSLCFLWRDIEDEDAMLFDTSIAEEVNVDDLTESLEPGGSESAGESPKFDLPSDWEEWIDSLG